MPQAQWRITDTETAGFDGGVCDVAIMAIDENYNELWRTQSLVDPERPISPGASGVHGIVDEMVYHEPTLAEWDHLNNSPFKVDNLVVIGHNISFDERMLQSVLPANYNRICTLRLAKLLWPDAENFKLQTLRYMFRLEAGDAHRAMGDVITCFSLLKIAGQQLDTDLHGLMEFCKRSTVTPDSKMGFGKHKDSKIKDVPKSYIRWMLDPIKNDRYSSMDPDLKAVLQTLI